MSPAQLHLPIATPASEIFDTDNSDSDIDWLTAIGLVSCTKPLSNTISILYKVYQCPEICPSITFLYQKVKLNHEIRDALIAYHLVENQHVYTLIIRVDVLLANDPFAIKSFYQSYNLDDLPSFTTKLHYYVQRDFVDRTFYHILYFMSAEISFILCQPRYSLFHISWDILYFMSAEIFFIVFHVSLLYFMSADLFFISFQLRYCLLHVSWDILAQQWFGLLRVLIDVLERITR